MNMYIYIHLWEDSWSPMAYYTNKVRDCQGTLALPASSCRRATRNSHDLTLTMIYCTTTCNNLPKLVDSRDHKLFTFCDYLLIAPKVVATWTSKVDSASAGARGRAPAGAGTCSGTLTWTPGLDYPHQPHRSYFCGHVTAELTCYRAARARPWQLKDLKIAAIPKRSGDEGLNKCNSKEVTKKGCKLRDTYWRL